MMTDVGLRTKILLSFVGVIFLSSLSTILAVIIATDRSVEAQARDKLFVGQKIFNQLLDIRAGQLFESTQVITSDFGFKTAVLTGDQSTIVSVLENHGARIGADLMMVASLTGELIASTRDQSQSTQFPFNDLVEEARQAGGLMTTVVLQGKPYQILMLPINAPVAKAWAIAGFEMDIALANQLKDLTNLEVSFSGYTDSGVRFELTTLELIDSNESMAYDESSDWKYLYKDSEQYLALINTIIDVDQAHVYATLSTSLEQALDVFEPLKIQILSIAVFAMLGSAFAGFVMSKNITKPVSKLVDAAERMSGGDYQVEILDDRFKQNEIAKLATSLDKMQNGIALREEKILHQAHHDTLTGLENRSAITQRINTLIERSKLTDATFGLLLIDLRRFKDVNDTFGYQIGDALLTEIAKRLYHLMGDQDLPSRIAVDEFLVVLTPTEDADLLDRSHQLLAALSEPYQVDDLSIKAVFYAGLSEFPEHGERTGELLRRADIALNRGKATRIRMKRYELGADEHHQKQLHLVNALKSAITQGQMQVYYQPKIDLRKQAVTQVEALIRWVHPELGFVSPGEFIPLAEQSGLMPLITKWVITETVRQSVRWREEGRELEVAVNLSAYDLAMNDLPDFVDGVFEKHGVATSSFIFEVTESAMMDDPDQALDVLMRLKNRGFTLAVDDYGTGYSSLSQLKDLPVDELKIDMSFVLNLDKSKYDQAIVQSTIEMAHKLGLSVVAEGVENLESWKLLEQWHCDKLQGFFISKPLPADAFNAWSDTYVLPVENA